MDSSNSIMKLSTPEIRQEELPSAQNKNIEINLEQMTKFEKILASITRALNILIDTDNSKNFEK